MAQQYQSLFLRMWRRHWKLTLLVTSSCIALAGLISHLLPHRYESEMKFLVNNERADMVITSGANPSPAPPAEVNETEVNSEIELLRSRDILERIVLDHGLYLPFERNAAGMPSRKSIERATDKLNKALSVSAMRKTNIIDVTYGDTDPNSAIGVLQDIGQRYLAAHLVAHSAPGTEEFFRVQVFHFAKELMVARTALSDFHRTTQLFSMPEQQSALIQRLATVSAQLTDVTAQIHVQDNRLIESDRQLSGVPERVVTQVRQTSDQLALQQVEPMLAQLENRRIELNTKFKSSDRLVRELDEQIANTHKEVEHLRTDRMEEKTTDLDALHQSIKAEAAKSRIDLTGLATQRVELEHMRQELLRQLNSLDRAYIQEQELERSEKEAQDNLTVYTHRLDEASLAQALDRDKFSNVVMIEKPVASPIAISPNLPLNLAAGLIVGVLLSLGLVLLAESRGGGLLSFGETSAPRSQDLAGSPFQVASGD